MHKRWFALAAAMLVCITCPGCGAGPGDELPPLEAETAQEIFRAYGEELRWIQETYGAEIRAYTEETCEILTRAAVEQYGTERFDRLSQLVTDLTAASWSSGDGGDAWTVASAFGPLKGICFWEVPVGVSMAGDLTGTVEIVRGDIVQGWEIAKPVSVEISLDQVDGSADRTTFPDGAAVASHRIFTGVLWGVILKGPEKSTWFWEDGEAEYRIACPRGVGYAHLAQIANPMYVERAGDSEIVACDHFLDFQERLAEDPGQFL